MPRGAGSGLDTITFSHFLPHQDLLPEKRLLSFPNLVSMQPCRFLPGTQNSKQATQQPCPALP